ncbi:MAG: hypothetical protein ACPHL6_00505 [Rubripirellula sp.]
MYLLPCTACQQSVAIAPSQAGGILTCVHCQASVQVPKLGELKQLPKAADDQTPSEKQVASSEYSPAVRAGFLVSGFAATACLLIASFCGLRWFLLPVPNSTAGHIESTRADIESFTAAELIRAYEEMEKIPIDLVRPYIYKEKETVRNRWGMNAVYSGSAGAVAVAMAAFLATVGRKRSG